MKTIVLTLATVLLSQYCVFSQNTSEKCLSINESSFEDSVTYYDDSMITTLLIDYFSSTENRKEKRDCYKRYARLFMQTLYSQVTSPIMYFGYYMQRKKITERIEDFYQKHGLSNIENIGNDITNGVVDKKEFRRSLGTFYYHLWLYGDTKDPVYTGGVPDDYKPSLPLFWRRWLFCGVRNPRWNATYVNNYTSSIVEVSTPFDNRTEETGSNYGTGDTKLGVWLRWYIDADGKWWFFYESTRKKNYKRGSLFYFGVVGLGAKQDGIQTEEIKKGRFEFSLNRTVTFE